MVILFWGCNRTIKLPDRAKTYLSLVNDHSDEMPNGVLFSALPVTIIGTHSYRKLTEVVTEFDEAKSHSKKHTLTIVNSSGLIIQPEKYALRFKPDKSQPRKLYGILAGFFVTLESLEEIGKSVKEKALL